MCPGKRPEYQHLRLTADVKTFASDRQLKRLAFHVSCECRLLCSLTMEVHAALRVGMK